MRFYSDIVKEVEVENKLRIYVGVRGRGDTADSYFRARAPWRVCQHFAGAEFDVTIGRMTDAALDYYDLIWAQRPNSSEEEMILRMAKAEGLPTVVDVDDDLFDIPPSAGDIFDHYLNRGRSKYAADGTLDVKKPLAHHQRCLHLADVVTVPTAKLPGVIGQYIPGDPVFRVLPNCVLWGDWDWLSGNYGSSLELSIGWFGHFYHSHDLQWIAPMLDEVTEKTGAKLVVMGQPEIVDLFPPSLAENTCIENIVPFSSFSTLRQLIKTFDVGICPLMDIRFNRGKSWLKALQFGAAGVVPVCSAVVYDQLPELVEMGLVAGDEEEFGAILTWLLEDPDERRHLAREWHDIVMRRYSYESLAFEMDGRAVPNALRWLHLARELCREE